MSSFPAKFGLSGDFFAFVCVQWPIVFSTDAFHKDDFIFKGRMQPHSLAGTEGADVFEELDMQTDDLWLPKPRFSAFFNTDLALYPLLRVATSADLIAELLEKA